MALPSFWGRMPWLKWLSDEFQASLALFLSYLLPKVYMRNGRMKKRKSDVQSIKHNQAVLGNTKCSLLCSALLFCLGAWCQHIDTHTHTFPVVGRPWGRANSPRDCGNKWGRDDCGLGGDGEKSRVGSKQETLMKYEGLSMAAWFLPSTTSSPLSWAPPAPGTLRGRWVTLEWVGRKAHAEFKRAKTVLTITLHLLSIFIIIIL